MKYTPDLSGINSLGGFSYQIKTFFYYMQSLRDGMQIEFETIEDVNIKKTKQDQLDKKSLSFINKIYGDNSNIAIQVKRTSLDESDSLKILYNWIILEKSQHVITKFILFTDEAYGNTDILFNKPINEVFDIIQASDKRRNANISKVKNLFNGDFDDFEKVYNSIQSKYDFKSISNIDNEILECYATLFRRVVVNDIVYFCRIKELLNHVTVEIMESINNKKPFCLTFREFMTKIEDISLRIKEDIMIPHYADFKKINSINLIDSEIVESREYKQLIACNLPSNLIEQHLLYCDYYGEARLNYMESNKVSMIDNIEETASENFEEVKHDLKSRNSDKPYLRLQETKVKENSYADNTQLKYGSLIYLTKDIELCQISWEDEYNAKTES